MRRPVEKAPGHPAGRLIGLLLVTACIASPSLRAAEPPAAPSRTVVVLDFVNRHPGDGRDWVGKGLADMLATDLWGSRRLTVIDRKRTRKLLGEMGLAAAGLMDPATAAKVGKTAKVDLVVFGTFRHDGDRLTIEVLLHDVGRGELLRIEQVAGPADELFALHRQLADRLLARLDVPMTPAELQAVQRLRTKSLPAFEHHARSLDHFDHGRWLAALREERLARRADPTYLQSRIHLAGLYNDVGQPEHAVVEYRALQSADPENQLPELVYFRLGQTLEKLNQPEAALAAYQRVLDKHPEYKRLLNGVYNAAAVSPLDIQRFDEAHDIGMTALERAGAICEALGREQEAALHYCRLINFQVHIYRQNGPRGMVRRRHDRVRGRYTWLYWRLVRENREGDLVPPGFGHVRLPPDGDSFVDDTDAVFRPVFGAYNSMGQTYVAPPGREIAEVVVAVKRTYAKHAHVTWVWPDRHPPHAKKYELPGDEGWQRVRFQFEPGTRGGLLKASRIGQWRVSVRLRSWAGPAPMSPFGAIRAFASGEGAKLFVDGKRIDSYGENKVAVGPHELEARWPDRRVARKRFRMEANTLQHFHLTAPPRKGGHIPVRASDLNLMADAEGRLWLLWDQARERMYGNLEHHQSDLFVATSMDGKNWSKPRRLPVSSGEVDYQPILQQAPDGTYWLSWSSQRDPGDPRRIWIASSEDMRQWSFPRKVDLPLLPYPEGLQDPRWPSREHAFHIDPDGTFWMIREGCVFSSEDGIRWRRREILKTYDFIDRDHRGGFGHQYHLGSDRQGTLYLLSSRSGSTNPSFVDLRSQTFIGFWRRRPDGRWEDLGVVSGRDSFWAKALPIEQGRFAVILWEHESNVPATRIRYYDSTLGWSEPHQLEGLKHPQWTSLAPVRSGGYVLVYTLTGSIQSRVVDLPRLPFPSPTSDATDDPPTLDGPAANFPMSAARAKEIQRAAARQDGMPASFANSIGVRMVYVPPGTFLMGSPNDEAGREDDEGPRHRVTITRGFYMSATEVTNVQYQSLITARYGEYPDLSRGFTQPSQPAVCMVWYWDLQEFCKNLSAKEKRTYRIPTEAEWEYACRAGAATPFHFAKAEVDLAEYAWYLGNSDGRTHPVAQKRPNAWGLYDMHGNVAEWCLDGYDAYGANDEVDPLRANWNPTRVIRGGSWRDAASGCRSAARNKLPWRKLSRATGFRLVWVPEADEPIPTTQPTE